ncbi:MAG: hypothetical protein OXI81_11345 [Paracoccaceae bacterium]|nr:hypothetical protein [Paracoccaceae bacterium]
MSGAEDGSVSGLRCEAEERAPVSLVFGLGLQLAACTLAVPILIPTAVMRTAGASESFLAWAVFASVAISGVTTAFQAVRFGRFGGGLMLVMGSSGAFIGISITAVAAGGPPLLASLVIVAALFQIVIATRLVVFRRILTPTVSGTVIMLVPVTVMPIVFDMLIDVPDGTPAFAAPAIAFAAVLTILVVSLKGTPSLRLWAPIIGICAGTALALVFGLYDLERVAAAPVFGIPQVDVPGFDLDFGPGFWALLPAFLLTAMVGSIRGIGSSSALQKVSWRKPRPVDLRATQGTLMVDGIGNLLCAVSGTVPNTTYSLAAPLIEITRIAARSVSVATGAIFLSAAFLPKVLAVVLAIPGPVVSAYLFVLVALLFTIGIGMVMQGGMDLRKSVVVGVSFWLGVGFEIGAIFPELVSGFAGGIFANGITSGGLAAILLSWVVEFPGPRRARMSSELASEAGPEIRAFLADFAARNGREDAMAERLDAAGEAVLSALLQPGDGVGTPGRPKRLRLSASQEKGGAVLEFMVPPRSENMQVRLARLETPGDETAEGSDAVLRSLRQIATSLTHQQYHDLDIVTVRVSSSASDA